MKSMVTFIAVLAVTASFAKAKLEFQLQRCSVESVTDTDEKIVFIVSGACRFLLDTTGPGSAMEAKCQLLHAMIVIKNQYVGQSPEQRQQNWQEIREKALALKNKTIWMDCFKTTTIIEEYRVTYVSCATASFGEVKEH